MHHTVTAHPPCPCPILKIKAELKRAAFFCFLLNISFSSTVIKPKGLKSLLYRGFLAGVKWRERWHGHRAIVYMVYTSDNVTFCTPTLFLALTNKRPTVVFLLFFLKPSQNSFPDSTPSHL